MTDNQIREEAYRLFYALNPELLPYHFPEDYTLDGERTGEGDCSDPAESMARKEKTE